ncbi:UDP-N-acetylmuramate--L-alanine ligase [Actinocrinis puniceicyclus]|uniref:UDP-N-acetylmuramate--L-alanine ligase n=1 Tax=Actinocrinis puniceicyclus TaxID=977794 RepID=A0A8J7WKN5_9ACTN|nr:UDP-N-acetylmuramate--L-alanine ligase [Actinocrinis puniceicyclus]MBS2964061.1 UDP-N-acetylmuramate--L-alanine ligase [Actinocrinis puniceicyclus]
MSVGPTHGLADPRGYEPPQSIPAAEELGRIHFVGIGGVGMAPVARIAAERGLPVSGSDIKRTATIDALRAAGALIRIGQAPENLDGVDTVVATTGVRPDNVEFVEAMRRGLRIIHRATALAALMVGRTAVLVAGTHGKTTTTSMLAVALDVLGLDPSYAIGGEIGASGVSGHAGGGAVFVAEADESDGTFRHYEPDIAVVTNVELDHTDYFGSLDDVHKAFVSFVDRLKPGGLLVVCADDPGAVAVGRVAQDTGLRVVWYGENAAVPGQPSRAGRPEGEQTVDYRIEGVELVGGAARFDIRAKATGMVHHLRLGVPGRHNAANGTAAFAVLDALGTDLNRAPDALAAFHGARRRMDFKGEAGGVRVYDDYMHHPTEIAATLAAFRALAGDGRLIVAFQPQRYTRARTFLREYGPRLGAADAVVVLEVYPGSGEDPIEGVTGAVIAGDIPLPPDRVVFEPDSAAVPARLVAWARPGDLIVTAGAGDVTSLGAKILDLLAAGDGAASPEPAGAEAGSDS